MRKVEIDTRRLVEAFAPDGLHGVGMVEIARAAGVAKPTLYRSHPSKDALFLACVEAEVERLLERLYEAWAAALATGPAMSGVAGVRAESLVGDGPNGGGAAESQATAARSAPLVDVLAALVRALLAYADEEPEAFRLLFVTAAHSGSTVAEDVTGTLDRITDRLAELLARHPEWHADPADAELVAGLLPAAAVNAVARAEEPDWNRSALAARVAALLVPPPVGVAPF